MNSTDKEMVDLLVEARKEKNSVEAATFAIGRDGEGNLTPLRESIPNNDPNLAIHAEPQVMADLYGKPKPHTIAVDQVPCGSCAPKIKEADIDKVIVPQSIGKQGSPKTASIKAASGRMQVEAVELNKNLGLGND